jgi:hypothetical protein
MFPFLPFHSVRPRSKPSVTPLRNEDETVTEDGKTFYEAQIKTGGRKSEVKVDAAGQLIR